MMKIMKMKKTALSLSMLALAVLLLVAPASADTLSLTLSNPVQTGAPGSTLTFGATVSAPLSNSATVFLNSDNYNVNIPGSTVDDFFLFDFPLSLDPGHDFTGTLFSVTLPSIVAPGIHTGFFEIFGGSGPDTGNLLATANFQISTPSAVPEPNTWLLLATGLGVLIFGRRYLPQFYRTGLATHTS
jgi:hypothetical protein